MADEQPQLHDLTKLLLDRMKTYPEEFIAGKWEYEIGVVNTVEAGDNRKVLNDALDNHRMNLTLQKALQKLLVPEEKEPERKFFFPGGMRLGQEDREEILKAISAHRNVAERIVETYNIAQDSLLYTHIPSGRGCILNGREIQDLATHPNAADLFAQRVRQGLKL